MADLMLTAKSQDGLELPILQHLPATSRFVARQLSSLGVVRPNRANAKFICGFRSL